jgi:hypothetical protein
MRNVKDNSLTLNLGDLHQVDSGNYRVVGVSKWGEIFYRSDITKDLPMGRKWVQIPGAMMMVTTSGTAVTWGLDKFHNVWFHNDGKANKIPQNK